MKSLLIIFTLFFLSACSESIKPIDTAIEDQILYIGNGTEPQDLDPHIVTGVPESKVLMALLEGLVIRNPEAQILYLVLLRTGLFQEMVKPISLTLEMTQLGLTEIL